MLLLRLCLSELELLSGRDWSEPTEDTSSGKHACRAGQLQSRSGHGRHAADVDNDGHLAVADLLAQMVPWSCHRPCRLRRARDRTRLRSGLTSAKLVAVLVWESLAVDARHGCSAVRLDRVTVSPCKRLRAWQVSAECVPASDGINSRHTELEGCAAVLLSSAIVIFALAESNGPSVDRCSRSVESLAELGAFLDNAPLAACVPPRISAQPATPPSATLVIRLTVSPPRVRCLRVLGNSYITWLSSGAIRP